MTNHFELSSLILHNLASWWRIVISGKQHLQRLGRLDPPFQTHFQVSLKWIRHVFVKADIGYINFYWKNSSLYYVFLPKTAWTWIVWIGPRLCRMIQLNLNPGLLRLGNRCRSILLHSHSSLEQTALFWGERRRRWTKERTRHTANFVTLPQSGSQSAAPFPDSPQFHFVSRLSNFRGMDAEST